MVVIVMMVLLLLLLLLLMRVGLLLGKEQFGLAQIAPDPLGGKVHMDTVRTVRLEVDGAVIFVLFRASYMETVLLQTYPQVWSIGFAIRTRFILFQLAQLHQRELHDVVQVSAFHRCSSFGATLVSPCNAVAVPKTLLTSHRKRQP